MAKRINCSVKGKVNEREIVHILNERFKSIIEKNPDGGAFSRSIGSGNRFGQQVQLSTAGKQVFASDITPPLGFKFAIESKAGYDIDLHSIFDSGIGQLDSFIKQVTNDSVQSGRAPLLLYKKDRRPRIAFIHSKLLMNSTVNYNYCIIYREWVGVSLENLIKEPDSFFFEIKE